MAVEVTGATTPANPIPNIVTAGDTSVMNEECVGNLEVVTLAAGAADQDVAAAPVFLKRSSSTS
jgi:hypothetical protein